MLVAAWCIIEFSLVAASEGESRTARTRPQRPGGRIAQGRWLLNRSRAGFACVYKPGWLWPLRMAKRVSERATRGGEHSGVGTPHARGASGEALGVGSDEASSVSFCLRLVSLVSPGRMQACLATRVRIAGDRLRSS